MKKTGLVLVALAGLTLMGCAGRYYDNDRYYGDGYHRYDRGDRDYRDRDRYNRERYDRYNDRY